MSHILERPAMIPERRRPALLPWIRDGLALLRDVPGNGPDPRWQYLLGSALAFLLWRQGVAPLLTAAPQDLGLLRLVARWMPEPMSLIEALSQLQGLILDHQLNRLTLLLAVWAVAVSVVRMVWVAVWRVRLGLSRANLRSFLAAFSQDHAGTRLNTWLRRQGRGGVVGTLVREIYEEMAYRAPDPAAGFNARTQAVVERCERTSALLRVVVWAIPILGFVGTVLGISEAIGSFSRLSQAGEAGGVAGFVPQFQSTMDAVMGGLGTAFHTTLVALVAVLPVAFWVEVASLLETSTLVRGRSHVFRSLWCDLAPAWRSDLALVSPAEGGATAERFAAAIEHLAQRVERLGGRIASTHGIVDDLGDQVARLRDVLDAVEVEPSTVVS